MMFPQLGTGALTQCPLVKRRVARTVVEETPDGTLTARADLGAQWCEWELRYDVLTRAERNALADFVESVEGRLREFVFADPLGNLLRWSEDLSQDAWSKDPQVQVNGPVVTNAGQAAQSVWQSVPVPGAYAYALGVRVSAALPTPVTLFFGDGATREEETVMAGPDVREVTISGAVGSGATDMRFGFSLPAGTTIRVDWMHAAAQRGLGAYQQTFDRAGVYPRTRLAQDELVWSVLGPDWYATTLKLTAWAG